MKTLVATKKDRTDGAAVLNALLGYPSKGHLAGVPTGGERIIEIPDEPFDKDGYISIGWSGYQETEDPKLGLVLLVDDRAETLLHNPSAINKLPAELAAKATKLTNLLNNIEPNSSKTYSIE